MLRIGICDDEKSLRKSLHETLSLVLDLQGLKGNIVEFESGESFLASPESENIDILFLDIEMKDMNGMETAKNLREKNERTVIIFVTSHPDYVFQGYEVRALSYILKPYGEDKIIKIFRSALKELDALEEGYYLIEQKSGVRKVAYSTLLYFKSERRLVTVVTTDTTYDFYGKLDTLIQELPPFFVRTHNRYIVNINYISSLGGSSLVCNREELPISRSYHQDVSVSFAKKILR